MEVPAAFNLGNKEFWGEIYNLNAEGAFLKCATIVPPFAVLKNLRFTLPVGVAVHVAEALVVWNNDNSRESLYPRGMGLFFQVIEASQLALIKDHLNQTAIY